MFGFTNTLLDIINKQKPTHLAVVFDTDKPTHRHIEFETYKAHREEMPEDLRKSLPYIVRILEAFNVPVITMDGFEADDIIGTLAWRVEGVDVFMMTPDKDFGQLVRDRVYIYKPGRMGNPDEILGVPEILSRWEVERVDQVIDILGLWGDAVDNIPGVPGVGEKTAKKLIQEYGSLEGVLQNVDQLKGKMKEKFQEFSEQAIVSKRLATIDTQVPVEITLEDLARKEPNEELLTQVFQELEFRTMLKRVFPGSPSGLMDGDSMGNIEKTSPEKPKKRAESNPMQTSLFGFESSEVGVEAEEAISYLTIKDVKHEYSIIQTEEEWSNLLKELNGVSEFCFDTETSDLDLFEAKIVGVSLTWKEHQGVYIPISSLEDEAKKQLAKLADVFNSDKLKIAQNLKFDMAILKKYGLEIKGPFFDTMLAHYLIEPDQRHNMQVLSESYLGYSPISIENLIGKKGKNQGSMADVPLEMIAEYAAEDTDVTFRLKKKLAIELGSRGLNDVFSNIEMPLVRVLMDMEHEGVRIDVNFLNHYSKELNDQAVAIQQKIFELAGLQFNIASPSQVGNILFDHLKLVDKPKKTKTGQYQTDEETLQTLKGKHEIIDHILSFRALQKLKSTYVDALPAIVKVQSGKVHTSFNQAVAATGRLSSQNPNLQNIPIRTDLGREIRKAFIPSDSEHVLLSADYSQI